MQPAMNSPNPPAANCRRTAIDTAPGQNCQVTTTDCLASYFQIGFCHATPESGSAMRRHRPCTSPCRRGFRRNLIISSIRRHSAAGFCPGRRGGDRESQPGSVVVPRRQTESPLLVFAGITDLCGRGSAYPSRLESLGDLRALELVPGAFRR